MQLNSNLKGSVEKASLDAKKKAEEEKKLEEEKKVEEKPGKKKKKKTESIVVDPIAEENSKENISQGKPDDNDDNKSK